MSVQPQSASRQEGMPLKDLLLGFIAIGLGIFLGVFMKNTGERTTTIFLWAVGFFIVGFLSVFKGMERLRDFTAPSTTLDALAVTTKEKVKDPIAPEFYWWFVGGAILGGIIVPLILITVFDILPTMDGVTPFALFVGSVLGSIVFILGFDTRGNLRWLRAIPIVIIAGVASEFLATKFGYRIPLFGGDIGFLVYFAFGRSAAACGQIASNISAKRNQREA